MALMFLSVRMGSAFSAASRNPPSKVRETARGGEGGLPFHLGEHPVQRNRFEVEFFERGEVGAERRRGDAILHQIGRVVANLLVDEYGPLSNPGHAAPLQIRIHIKKFSRSIL